MQTYRAKLTSASDWEPGETGFVVTFPDWGWGATQGETEMEALHKAEDALEEMIATTLMDGGELPSVPPSADARSRRAAGDGGRSDGRQSRAVPDAEGNGAQSCRARTPP